RNIWSAPMVRSSYFADRQYHGEPVPEVRRKVDPAKKIAVQVVEA
ncbi:lipoyl synthase, partial [Acinetobacter baumannii]|nr:lipoyl synthase [Acinetobacter baumannii]